MYASLEYIKEIDHVCAYKMLPLLKKKYYLFYFIFKVYCTLVEWQKKTFLNNFSIFVDGRESSIHTWKRLFKKKKVYLSENFGYTRKKKRSISFVSNENHIFRCTILLYKLPFNHLIYLQFWYVCVIYFYKYSLLYVIFKPTLLNSTILYTKSSFYFFHWLINLYTLLVDILKP